MFGGQRRKKGKGWGKMLVHHEPDVKKGKTSRLSFHKRETQDGPVVRGKNSEGTSQLKKNGSTQEKNEG